jgi:hypothetical protein
VLSSGTDPAVHETDLITQFAVHLNGIPFGLVVGAIASVALVMAVNTAFVASSELMERVAHRYNFHWIIRTNNRQSLYRIHIISATFYSFIIVLTEGSQRALAEMYALGLVASFVINMGSLLIYRYGLGTKEIRAYNTSRAGTLVVFVLLVGCLVYLGMTKPYGLALWSSATVFFLIIGIRVAKHRSPETVQLAQTDYPLQMVLALAEAPGDVVDVYFKRPHESEGITQPNAAYVSFYHPRSGIPTRLAQNHYRFAYDGRLFESIYALLDVVQYELPHKQVNVHFGWPLSSWLDRLSIGVMVFSIMRMPKMFPTFNFSLEYFRRSDGAARG